MKKQSLPLPPHIIQQWGTQRNFKQDKRAEWKKVMQAFNKFQLGCVFVPGYDSIIHDMSDDIKTVQDGLSRANWGR